MNHNNEAASIITSSFFMNDRLIDWADDDERGTAASLLFGRETL